jgi:hypothetical protein
MRLRGNGWMSTTVASSKPFLLRKPNSRKCRPHQHRWPRLREALYPRPMKQIPSAVGRLTLPPLNAPTNFGTRNTTANSGNNRNDVCPQSG